MRRIVTDTFLTITGPGTNIKVCRALQDAAGNVAVWWKPKTSPQRLFTVGKAGLGMRGNLVGPDGTVYAFRRRGVSCTWSICKGKFTTKQVAAWWPEDSTTATPSAKVLAAADAADAEPEPDPVRERAAAAARATRTRTRPVTASERRAARARARAARATKAAVAERRAAAEALRTPPDDDGPLPPVEFLNTPETAPTPPPETTTAPATEATGTMVEQVAAEDAPNEIDGDPAADLHELVTDATNGDPDAAEALNESNGDALGIPPTTTASNAEIRAWAADNGYQVSPRGKIPEAVRTAYANAEQAGA